MHVTFNRDFTKQRHRLPRKQQEQLRRRIKLFQRDRSASVLKDHALTGRYQGYRSINVTGDMRAIYRLRRRDEAFFVAVGSHSQLYG